jgi:hypothetical protein
MKKLILAALVSLIGFTSFTPTQTFKTTNTVVKTNYPTQADVYVEDANTILVRVWMDHIVDDGLLYYVDVQVEYHQKLYTVYNTYRVFIDYGGYGQGLFTHVPTKIPIWGVNKGVIIGWGTY